MRQVLLEHHNTETCEQETWSKLQLLIYPSEHGVYQGRSVLIGKLSSANEENMASITLPFRSSCNKFLPILLPHLSLPADQQKCVQNEYK